jgi:hypothetical protein
MSFATRRALACMGKGLGLADMERSRPYVERVLQFELSEFCEVASPAVYL